MTGSVGELLVYVSFVLWVSTGVSVAALLVLRRTQPDLPRPIRVSLVFPWLYIFLTTILVVASMVADFHSTGESSFRGNKPKNCSKTLIGLLLLDRHRDPHHTDGRSSLRFLHLVASKLPEFQVFRPLLAGVQ